MEEYTPSLRSISNVAINCSNHTQLWQRVFVHLRLSASHATAESKAQGLLLWIERSGSLPLTLFVWYYTQPCTAQSGAGDPFVEVFNRYASRWEALYFRRSDFISAH